MPTCWDGVRPRDKNVWKDGRGDLMKEIPVYFAEEELKKQNVHYNNDKLKSSNILGVVKNHWVLKVPSFVPAIREEDARLVVRFTTDKGKSSWCVIFL